MTLYMTEVGISNPTNKQTGSTDMATINKDRVDFELLATAEAVRRFGIDSSKGNKLIH